MITKCLTLEFKEYDQDKATEAYLKRDKLHEAMDAKFGIGWRARASGLRFRYIDPENPKRFLTKEEIK